MGVRFFRQGKPLVAEVTGISEDQWAYVEAWVVGAHEIPEAISTRSDLPRVVVNGDVLVLLPSGGFELYESESDFVAAGYEWAEDGEQVQEGE